MGDAGEGLVDAEARAQERMDERERERERAHKRAVAALDPGKERLINSLKLAKTDLSRQLETAQNPRRLEQVRQALHDVERRLTELG